MSRHKIAGLTLAAGIGLLIWSVAVHNQQTLHASDTPPIPAVAAKTANSFMDSLGMNVHSYWWTPAQTTTYLNALRDLNIGYVRDEFAYSYANYIANNGYGSGWIQRLQQFHSQAGISASIISQELVTTPSDVVSYVKLANQLPGTISDIEGPNEVDYQCAPNGTEFTGHIWVACPTNIWLNRTEQYVIGIKNALRGDPSTTNTTIYSPSVDAPNYNVGSTVFRNTSQFGNVHYYQYYVGDVSSSTEEQLRNAAALYGTNPIVMTEDGYPSQPPTTFNRPANEQIQAEVLPIYYLANFKAGVKRTFLYQLVDDSASSDFFGLINDVTGRKKPALTAIQNLASLLKDSTNSFTPSSLRYQLTGTNLGISQLLLEKTSGEFDLVLWPTALAQSPTPVPGQVLPTLNTTVSFGDPIESVSSFKPLTSQDATQTVSQPSQMSVSLSTGPVILRVRVSASQGSSGSSGSLGSLGTSGTSSSTTNGSSKGTSSTKKSTGSSNSTAPAAGNNAQSATDNGFFLPTIKAIAGHDWWQSVVAFFSAVLSWIIHLFVK